MEKRENRRKNIPEERKVKQLNKHVRRMTPERLLKYILNWVPAGRRRRGRLRKRQSKCINKEMQKRGLEESHRNERVKWRLDIKKRNLEYLTAMIDRVVKGQIWYTENLEIPFLNFLSLKLFFLKEQNRLKRISTSVILPPVNTLILFSGSNIHINKNKENLFL